MNRCLSHEAIEHYARRLCSASEAQAVEAHIAGCEPCRKLVEQARCGSPGEPQKSAGTNATQQVTQTQVPPSQDAMPTLSMPQPSGYSTEQRPDRSASSLLFEGYQILEELPQGGQAVVYKAIHKATKAKVALKVLLPGLVGNEKARQYFRQEVELAASLNHPNIVAIRDSGISQGQYYFAMNYIHGQPLDRYLLAKMPSLRDKLILFGKICDAVAHAHQRGVIHRDLKPSNIMVDERDEPHILDFGLAKTAANLSSSTEVSILPTITGQIKGTVAYMSPEQAAGRSDLVDVRSDVYSLGVVLYQMCTGKLPYDVLGTILEALKNIQYADPQRPRQTISRFDSDVEAIILKCLAKDPNQRYQSASELKQDVQRWLDGLPIVAKSISSMYLLRKIVARHRYTATVVTSLLVILCASVSISFRMYQDAREAQRQAEEAARQATRIAEQTKANTKEVARFMADFMVRNAPWTSDPSVLFGSYGPRRQTREMLPGDRAPAPGSPSSALHDGSRSP